jgi:hypothetical protein
MKKIVLALLLISGISCLAQSFNTVTLVPQRTYYLNGGLRASAGGLSRETIRIDLPPNTVSWYYSFYTAPGADGTELLNLGLQLGAHAFGGKVGSSLSSSIKVPKGSGSADVFVLPPKHRDAFKSKQEDSWKYIPDISLLNTLQAVQYIDKKYGSSFYLGLRNPSSLTGVGITIEVVAIVEEANLNHDKGISYGNLGWRAFERGDYDQCLVLSEKALTYDPNLYYVKFNIALVSLVQGKDNCLDLYIETIATINGDKTPKATLTGALKDVTDLKLRSPQLKYIVDVESLLTDALSKH